MNQCSSSAPLAANFAPTNCSAAPPDHTPSTLVALFRTHQLLEISRHDAPFRHGRQLQRRRSKRTNNHLMIITSQSNKNTHRRFCASSTRRRVLNESQPFPYKYVTFFFFLFCPRTIPPLKATRSCPPTHYRRFSCRSAFCHRKYFGFDATSPGD